jgi:hypothetical protein
MINLMPPNIFSKCKFTHNSERKANIFHQNLINSFISFKTNIKNISNFHGKRRFQKCLS